MIIAWRKRGKYYHLDISVGRVHCVRGPLGTQNLDVAKRLVHRIDMARAEGPKSEIWQELRVSLPPITFRRLAAYFRVEAKRYLTWSEYRPQFEDHQQRRVSLKELAPRTVENYRRSLDAFERFLSEEKIALLVDITKPLMERFSRWQIKEVTQKNATGVETLKSALHHLHHVFKVAIDLELIERNPVTPPKKRFDPNRGYRPYTSDELARLYESAQSEGLFESDHNWMPFIVARWTGLRSEDLITLQWKEISLADGEIQRVCQKNKTTAYIPIKPELRTALEAEYAKRNPGPNDSVVLNPKSGSPFEYPDWYNFVRTLGQRANVHAHPHRFRSTFAVTMLRLVADVYKVSKMLGDTVEVVIRHYVRYVPELRKDAIELVSNNVKFELRDTVASQKFRRA